MRRRVAIGAVALSVLLAPPAWPRDPGDTATRAGNHSGGQPAKTNPNDQFVPERIPPSELHPPTHVEPPEPPLYQRVESDIDRGTGRIEDEYTRELRRLQEDRDFPPGRFPQADIKRERQRFQEDLDRRDRLDRLAAAQDVQAKRAAAAAHEAAAAERARHSEPLPQPMGSALTRWVAQQSKLLEDARKKYQADLAAAEAQRDEAVRTAPTREARAQAASKFDQRRLDLTRAYQAYRKKILGTD